MALRSRPLHNCREESPDTGEASPRRFQLTSGERSTLRRGIGMEPGIPTEEFERTRGPSPPAEATIELPRQSAEPPRPAASSTGRHCAACGAPLAPDQRYCVECGQRRGPTRPPFLEHIGQPRQAIASPPPRRKLRIHPNTALIAGIGTLMLAMATGVLIGRTSGPSSSKDVPVQYLTAPTGSAPSTTSTTPSSTEGSSSKAGGGSGKASPNAAAKILKGKAPPKAVVKPGTPGKGPGYQKGRFTGKFFGGSESKKQEEEEELGEEGGEKESSGSGKGGK
jgi:hypothetical protein